MMKKILAAAIVSAFAAPAFAATANVDVYGQMNVSVDYVNFDDGSSDKKAMRVNNNASRLGFKGAEDLGGGLSAIWQYELGITPDSAAATDAFTSRTKFVGLASKAMGTIRLGAIDTPYKMATGRLDLFGDSLGDYNTIMGSVDGGNGIFDPRASNAIEYTSPSFGGLVLGLQYAQGDETAHDASDPNSQSASLVYSNGPLFGSLAYERQNDVGGTNTFAGTNRKGMKLGLGYKFGNTTLGGAYERLSATGNVAADRNAWFVSASHKMGAIALLAQYANAGESDAAAGNDGAKFYAVGADYSLSKRTVLTGLYSKIKNDANANYVLGGNGNNVGATGAGNDPSAFSLRVKHSF